MTVTTKDTIYNDDNPDISQEGSLEESGSWTDQLSLNKNGRACNTLCNMRLILENDEDFQGIVFNQLADDLEIRGSVPWNHNSKYWRDVDDAHLMCLIDERYGSFTQNNYRTALSKVTDDRSYHPVKDYFASLPEWDNKPRIDTLLIDYFGADDNPYVRAVTRKILCAAVRRIYEPGIKFDHILVLNGPQGIGKSTFISKLGMEWYSDSLSISDMNDKTAAEKLQGYWIQEIGELAGIRKADIDKVKAFISRQDDKYRASYGRRVRTPGTDILKPWDLTQDDVDQICILGTKGKTTTARMLHSILSCAMDSPVSYTTTNRSFDGLKTIRFPGTVSDPTVWYPLCERSIKNGCRVMVSEMPSYAEYFSRLTGIEFLYGIFTNLDRDHVSPFGHPTYESYVESKKKLAARCKNMLANRDDRHYEEFLDAAVNAYSKMTYSLNDENADFYVQDICKLNRGYSFTMITPTWEKKMSILMSGVFNVSNALAAGSLAYMMGIGPEHITKGLGSIRVEGRMEKYEHDGYLAFVDYAHNGLSFREVFKSLKQDYPCRKIIVVTGIGGQVSEYTHTDNADAIAANAAHSIITTDNPLTDDPAELCFNFRNLIVERGGSAEIITDRKEAIKTAIARLKADEVLLVAGMGDDRGIRFYNHVEPYDGDDILTKMYIEEK